MRAWLRQLWRRFWYDELREYQRGVKLLERRLGEPVMEITHREETPEGKVYIEGEWKWRLASPENSPEAGESEPPKSK